MAIIKFKFVKLFLALKLATKVCEGLYFEFVGAKEVKFKVASLVKFELLQYLSIR